MNAFREFPGLSPYSSQSQVRSAIAHFLQQLMPNV